MKCQFVLQQNIEQELSKTKKFCWLSSYALTYQVVIFEWKNNHFSAKWWFLFFNSKCAIKSSRIFALHQFWFDNFEADLFEWSDLTISENTSCLEVFDSPRQTICQKEAKKDLILIETQTIFEDAKLNCNAIGGELFLPKNDSELDRLGNLIDSSKTCPNAILGGKKSNLGSKEIVDIYGQVVNITRWGPNRPNGREIQQCIETTRLYRWSTCVLVTSVGSWITWFISSCYIKLNKFTKWQLFTQNDYFIFQTWPFGVEKIYSFLSSLVIKHVSH